MTDLFNRYREFIEATETSMDDILGSRSRGDEIDDAAAFQEFWDYVAGRPVMRSQWENRLAPQGFQREREALRMLIFPLTADHSQTNVRKAA
jgi:hypothetical protein